MCSYNQYQVDFELETPIKIWTTLNDFNVRKGDLEIVKLLLWNEQIMNCSTACSIQSKDRNYWGS